MRFKCKNFYMLNTSVSRSTLKKNFFLNTIVISLFKMCTNCYQTLEGARSLPIKNSWLEGSPEDGGREPIQGEPWVRRRSRPGPGFAQLSLIPSALNHKISAKYSVNSTMDTLTQITIMSLVWYEVSSQTLTAL